MEREKTHLLAVIVLVITSIVNANPVLTVNGFDTSAPVEINADVNIIIGINHPNDVVSQNYMVTCEMGGKLTPLCEPNSLSEQQTTKRYLLNFDNEQISLATVNLTVNGVLDYQLAVFKVPDANIVVFGIDTDVMETLEKATELHQSESTESNVKGSGIDGDMESASITNNNSDNAPRVSAELQALQAVESKLEAKVSSRPLIGYKSQKEINSNKRLSVGRNKSVERTINNQRLNLEQIANPSFNAYESEAAKGASTGSMSLSAGAIDINDGTHFSENIILTGEYVLRGKAYIDPNVKIVFQKPCSIYVEAGVNAEFVLAARSTCIVDGTPEEPIVIYSDGGYNDYDSFLRVEGNDVDLKLGYFEIYNASKGLAFYGKGDFEVMDGLFWACNEGVFANGEMNLHIENNQFIDCWFIGIDIESFGFDSEYKVIGNLINGYQDYGIWVDGTMNSDDSSLIHIDDNLFIGSYQYAIVQVNGYQRMYDGRRCNGFYANAANVNPGNPFSDIYPQYLTEDPVIGGRFVYPFTITPDCNLIDNGSEFISQSQQLGKFASITPDIFVKDIGYHRFDPNYSNVGEVVDLAADLDRSLFVDYNDLKILCEHWLEDSDNDKWDIYSDGKVDFRDFAILAGQWNQQSVVYHPNISINCDSVISGQSGISVDGISSKTQLAKIYLDGKLIEEIDYTIEDDYGDPIYTGTGFESQQYGNGAHKIKVVTFDSYGLVTVSPTKTVTFDNSIHYYHQQDSINNGVKVSGFSEEEHRFLIEDWDENLIYTSPTLTGNINFHIPQSVFPGEVYTIATEKRHTEGGGGDWWEPLWQEGISQEPNLAENYEVVIILAEGSPAFQPWKHIADSRKEAVSKIIEWCQDRGKKYVVLYKKEARWNNVNTILSKPSVHAVYLVAHGGSGKSEPGGPSYENPYFILGKGRKKHYVFARDIYGVPSSISSKKVHFVHDWGFYDSKQIYAAYLNVCNTGRNYRMAKEWVDSDDIPILGQFVVTWNGACLDFNPNWQQWDFNIMEKWPDGVNSFYNAHEYALKKNDNGIFIFGRMTTLGESRYARWNW